MRPLRPNSQGMIAPSKSTFSSNRPEQIFTRPCPALQKIDRQRKGEPPTVLIIRSRGGIGDIMMTTPTAKAIAKKYNCQVDYCTDYEYLDGALPKAISYIPYIKKVLSLDDLTSVQDDYDAVINLTCPCSAHEKPLAPPINRIDLFARHAGIALDETSMDYVITPQELDWAKQYLVGHNLLDKTLVMVQPSSSHTQRDCPFSKLTAAINALTRIDPKLYFLIITHDNDNIKANWDLAHSFTLKNLDVRQLSAIMSYCKLVMCPDSAVLHMASAQHKKTVTLFGPTDPRARVNYHPEAVAIWPAKQLKNYPVWYADPKDGYLCWKLIEPQLIIDVSLALLRGLPLPINADLVTYGTYKRVASNYEII